MGKRAAKRRATRKAAKKASKPKAPKAAKATKPRAPKSKAKAVRARKPKRVTKKSQTGSKLRVWNGTRMFTKGGLTKKDLIKNSRGKIVSKKASKAKGANGWMKAVTKARKELGITGFCLMNRGAQGVALYKRAKEIYN